MKSFSTPPTFSPPPYSSQSTRPSRLPPLFHTLFLALSALAFIFALAIVACAAASIRAYHHSDLPPSWYLPLWPSQLDLRPTRALLAVGVIVAVVCLANLVVGLVPGVSSSRCSGWSCPFRALVKTGMHSVRAGLIRSRA